MTVLERFGNIPWPPMLSFPRPGLTLALQFASRQPETLCLLIDQNEDRAPPERIGRENPAKDAAHELLRTAEHLATLAGD